MTIWVTIFLGSVKTEQPSAPIVRRLFAQQQTFDGQFSPFIRTALSFDMSHRNYHRADMKVLNFSKRGNRHNNRYIERISDQNKQRPKGDTETARVEKHGCKKRL
eukprot:Selendium_serpulae@DN1678_c0_g1_i1.p1